MALSKRPPSLILVCGRSRAGKTTFCNRFHRSDVLHLDNYGHLNYEGLFDAVSARDSFTVVDGIFHTGELRSRLLDLWDGKAVCIWLDTPVDTVKGRLHRAARGRIFPEEFEQPTYDEGWDEIVRITC